MSNDAKEIRCPKIDHHIHKKILLIVGCDYLSVFCKEHGWIKITLKQAGVPIDFKHVSAELSVHEDQHFNLEPIPTVGLGEFKTKRKKNANHKN
jgi:hypothetical protein